MKYSILVVFMVSCFSCVTAPKVKPKPLELDWKFYVGSEPSQPADDPIVADAQKRSVTVITADGFCSGGIGATGIVLTAGHCASDVADKTIFVNGSRARVLAVIRSKVPDDGNDMLFLHIYTGEVKPLEFAEPKVDMEVFVVMTQDQYQGVVKRGRITHVEEFMFTTDIILIPGASGAFVYTKDGKLVGMITQFDALMSKAVSGVKIRQAVFERN